MKRKFLFLLTMALGVAVSAVAQDEYDDIYYSSSKKKTQQNQSAQSNPKGTSVPGTYYVEDMGAVDIDAYNRRGEAYYVTQIDTVGTAMANSQDFVYTQQIQKYYNPTIVVDNREVLSDILNNSYGNVEIIYNGITPYFVPTYTSLWSWPYYYPTPWSWNWSWNWGWGGINVGYNPWYWSYNPWYYNPWYPSCRPGWGWGGYYPKPPHYYHHWMADHYRPGGNRPVAPRPGWSGNTRPGYPNHGNNWAGTRPGGNGTRPGGNGTRPGGGNDSYVRPGISKPNGPVTARPGGMQQQTSTRPGTGQSTRPGNNNTTQGRPGGIQQQPTTRPGNNNTIQPARPTQPTQSATRPGVTHQGSTSTARPNSMQQESVRPNATQTARPYDRYQGTQPTQTTRPSARPQQQTRPQTTRPQQQTRPHTTRPQQQQTRPQTTRPQQSRPSYSRPSGGNRPSGGGYRPAGGGRSGGGHRR